MKSRARSPLQWWLERRRCRAWERGPGRRPTGEELTELRGRLNAVNALPKQRQPEPFVDDVKEFLDRMYAERAERERRYPAGGGGR